MVMITCSINDHGSQHQKILLPTLIGEHEIGPIPPFKHVSFKCRGYHILHGRRVDVALLDPAGGQLCCKDQWVAGHHNVTCKKTDFENFQLIVIW